MALSTAERQRQWRQRQTGAIRFSCYLSPEAGAALRRLGGWYRLSQRQLLERLAHSAETEALQAVVPGGLEWSLYFGKPEDTV